MKAIKHEKIQVMFQYWKRHLSRIRRSNNHKEHILVPLKPSWEELAKEHQTPNSKGDKSSCQSPESCYSWPTREGGSQSSCYLQPLWASRFGAILARPTGIPKRHELERVWCFIIPELLINKSLATFFWVTPLIKKKNPFNKRQMTLDQSSISKHPEYWIYNMRLAFVTPLAMHQICKASRYAQWN